MQNWTVFAQMADWSMDFFGGSLSKGQREANCTHRKGNLSVGQHCPTQRLSVCTHHAPTSCHIDMNDKKRKRPVLSTEIQLFQHNLRSYLDVSSVCGAEVRYCAPVDRYHVDRGDQGVGQLLVPVLQPLDKLGDLQAVLAFFAFVDSLVWVTIVGGALENEAKGTNKTESFWHLLKQAIITDTNNSLCVI